MSIDKREAARRLGISVAAVVSRAWRHNVGRLLHPNRPPGAGNPRLFCEDDIARLAAAGQRGRPPCTPCRFSKVRAHPYPSR